MNSCRPALPAGDWRDLTQDGSGNYIYTWDTSVADGRMDISFSFSIAERVNIYSLLLAGAFLHLVQMATDQVSVQLWR